MALVYFAMVCAGGIYLGIFVLRILEARNYDWVAITERTRSRRRAIAGSIERSVLQFTPYSWTKYQWKFFRSPKRLAYAILLVTVALVQELNSFFLKDIFLVPVASQLNVVRLLFWWAMAVIGVRDVYHFMTDASVKRYVPSCGDTTHCTHRAELGLSLSISPGSCRCFTLHHEPPINS